MSEHEFREGYSDDFINRQFNRIVISSEMSTSISAIAIKEWENELECATPADKLGELAVIKTTLSKFYKASNSFSEAMALADPAWFDEDKDFMQFLNNRYVAMIESGKTCINAYFDGYHDTEQLVQFVAELIQRGEEFEEENCGKYIDYGSFRRHATSQIYRETLRRRIKRAISDGKGEPGIRASVTDSFIDRFRRETGERIIATILNEKDKKTDTDN